MIMYSVPEKGNVSQQTGGILNERKYRKHGYDDFMDGCNLWSYVLPDDPSAEERAEETSGNAQQHVSR